MSVIKDGQRFAAVYIASKACSVNTAKHHKYISLLCNQFSQQVSKTVPHPQSTEEEFFACSALQLKLCERGENKTQKLPMTETRDWQLCLQSRVWKAGAVWIHFIQKMAPMTCPRCSERLDSVHVGAPYKSSRCLISNAFYSLSGMVELVVSKGWF